MNVDATRTLGISSGCIQRRPRLRSGSQRMACLAGAVERIAEGVTEALTRALASKLRDTEGSGRASARVSLNQHQDDALVEQALAARGTAPPSRSSRPRPIASMPSGC